MEEGETVSIPSRKELRKQKLIEYLAAKGKLKLPNPKSYLRDDGQVKKPVTSAVKVDWGKENKASANRWTEHSKIPTLAAQSTAYPARRAFGVSNKVNVKCTIPVGQKKTNGPSAPSGQAEPKQNKNQNPVFTRRYTGVSSKSNLKVASQLKKQLNTGVQSSGRASLNATHAAVSKPNSRFSSSSNAAWSCPVVTASVRMSLGPIVKTKTGLIPAVTQPRYSQNLAHTSAAVADTAASSVANRMRSGTLPSVSKRPSVVQGKTLPSTSRINLVNERTTVSSTARAKIKDEDPTRKSPLSNSLKSASRSSKCTAAPSKPEGRVGISRPNKSDGHPTDGPTKQRSELEWEKNGQQCKLASRTSSGPASRCSSRVISGAVQGAVAELGGTTKTCKKTDSEQGRSSANAPPPRTGMRRPGAPVMSQTAPQPARTISLTGQVTGGKTTKVPIRGIPQTEGKKQTAAQEERMRKLQEWREAKGISYKRPPMPPKPQAKYSVSVLQPFWATMKEEDDAHSLICAVDKSLADCIKLLGEGCPPDQVKAVMSRLPAVSQKFAKYWICQARLMEQEGNLDVLPTFEEAVGVVLEPVDELRTVVFEILKKKDEIRASDDSEREEHLIPAGESTPESIISPVMTPKPVRALICGEKGDSSVVKYKITATPGGPPSQQREPARVNGKEVRFFTPVRRSVRIERASLRYPVSLQDHDLCVASYNDLISKEDEERSEEQKARGDGPSPDTTPMYVYRQNEALKDKVVVQLVCDEDV